MGIFAIVALDRVRDSMYSPGSMLLLVYLFLWLFQLSFILVGIELVLEEISKAADVSSVISYSSCCDVPDESLVCSLRCRVQLFVVAGAVADQLAVPLS